MSKTGHSGKNASEGQFSEQMTLLSDHQKCSPENHFGFSIQVISLVHSLS